MRLLFCSFSSPGFLFPLVGLAAELRRRGHAIGFVSGPHAGEVLATAGFSRIPRSEHDGPSFNVSTWYVPISIAIDVKHIEYAIAREPPDAIVTHHLCFSALIVRDRHAVPAAVLGPMAYLYPPAQPTVTGLSAECTRRLQWRLEEGMSVLNASRELFRLPAQPAIADDHGMLGDAYMLRTAPCLETSLDAWPSKVHAVGPCIWEPAMDDAAWQDLRADFAAPEAPVVYVHNGRAFDSPSFWPQLVAALGPAPVQVVASVARMDTELGPLPSNFLVRPHVPQGLVLPHASAVIAGGHSSVAIGAAVHGVPSVLIPHGVETPENTDRLVSAGCALSLDINALTPDHVRYALDHVLGDDGMQRNCAALKDKLRALDSLATAATLVETMASTQAPVLRARAAVFTDAIENADRATSRADAFAT